MLDQRQNIHKTPEHRVYPGLAQRSLELLTGSIRRDALHAIRTTTVSQWELRDTEAPAVRFTHPRCDGQFIFSPSGSLEVLSLQTPTESLHLDGSCDMAQRICRFAQRQVAVLFLRSKRDAVKTLHALLAGGSHVSPCSSTYQEENIHHYDGTDRTDGWSRTGSVVTAFGKIDLKADHILYEIGGERGREMLHRRVNAEIAFGMYTRAREFERPGYRNPGMGIPLGTWMESSYAPDPSCSLPPAPSGVVENYVAIFNNAPLERIQTVLRGPSLDKAIALTREQILSALKFAQLLTPSSR